MQSYPCQICNGNNTQKFLELGMQPFANKLEPDRLAAKASELFDLSLRICNDCLYVWLECHAPKEELFTDNTYITGISQETKEDMKAFADSCIETCKIAPGSRVLDIASNDGTLLEFFSKEGMSILGVDPSRPAAEISKAKGIETINEFFDLKTAEEILLKYGKFDLITATNVITHVDNPIEFLESCKKILSSIGSIVVEFYNFDTLISNIAFDQIYHEHISYFNFTTFSNALNTVDLDAFKVEHVKSQGGSLRVFISWHGSKQIDASVNETLQKEGTTKEIRDRYLQFPILVSKRKNEILDLLKNEKSNGSRIAGFGASAKATVLLNYLGVSDETVTAIADNNEIKQGKYVPGVAIPIVSVQDLKKIEPDVIIIFAWNLRGELKRYLSRNFNSSTSVVTFMPRIERKQLIGDV